MVDTAPPTDFREFIANYEAAYDRNPEDDRCRHQLATLYDISGDLICLNHCDHNRIKELQESLLLWGRAYPLMHDNSAVQITLIFKIAQVLFLIGQPEEACSYLKIALECHAPVEIVNDDVPFFIARRPFAPLSRAPEDPCVLFRLIIFFLNKMQTDVMDDMPPVTQWYPQLLKCLHRIGDKPELEARKLIGKKLLAQQSYEEALEVLNQALWLEERCNPCNYEPFLQWLKESFQQAGREDLIPKINVYRFYEPVDAVKLHEAEEALAASPTDPLLRTRLGYRCLLNGMSLAAHCADNFLDQEFNDVVQLLERATSLLTDAHLLQRLEALYQLALAYDVLGDNNKACANLQTAVELHLIVPNIDPDLIRRARLTQSPFKGRESADHTITALMQRWEERAGESNPAIVKTISSFHNLILPNVNCNIP